MQLGMPYSTAFNHLPPTVDRNILGMKKECANFIKQELAQVNGAMGSYNPIQGFYGMHTKEYGKGEKLR
jgi:hypothetical protein